MKTNFSFLQRIILAILLFTYFSVSAQHKVLVFTKTNGFAHASIAAGVSMITNLGIANSLWTTVQTNDAAAFTTTNLAQYKAVIWCNTSGNNLLNTAQKTAFEGFIANGGGFVGIHAATDTYRDKSWPFYNELVGAIVQASPNHTSNNFRATMTVLNSSHPAVSFLGTTWTKPEEYYYWKINGGQLYAGNINLLRVAATGSNDYDEARPISWYKEYAGGRSFYTALGHNASDYTSNTNFIKHVEEGIKYVIGNTLKIANYYDDNDNFKISPNPVEEVLNINIANTEATTSFSIHSADGRFVLKSEIEPRSSWYRLNVSHLSKGVYFINSKTNEKFASFKFIKN